MLKNLSVQAVFFVAVFLVISWFRELSLLPTNGEQAMPDVMVESIAEQSSGQAISTMALLNTDGVNQPTLFYFWAPWCSVCKISMPNLEDFHQSQLDKPQEDRVKVVSVALSYESKQEVVDYLTDRKYQFTTVLGDGAISEAFKIKGFPTYYLVDKNGYLVSKSMGYSTELGMVLRSLTL